LQPRSTSENPRGRRGGRSRRPRSLLAIALLAIAALLVASCGGDDEDETTGATSAPDDGGEDNGGDGGEEASGESIPIGFINQDAGAVGTFPEMRLGMEAAVDYINKELGGVDGHPVELVNCSTEGTPESTQKCAQQMVSEDPLYVATGIDFFGATGYPVMTGAGLVVWGSLPLSTQESAMDNVFWVNAGNASTTTAEAVYINEQLPDVEHVTIITNANAASQASVPFVQKPLEAFGIEVSVVSVPDEQTDYLGPYTQALENDPDAFIVNTSPPGCISFAQVAERQGNELPIVSQLTCYNRTMREQIGAALEGWHIGLLTHNPEGDTEDAELFREVINGFEGDDADMTGFVPVSFQNMMTMYNNVLKPLGYDGLVNEDGSFNRDALIEELNEPGQLFLGGEYQCGEPPFPSACDYRSGWYVVGPGPDLPLEDQLDGELIDARPVVEEHLSDLS